MGRFNRRGGTSDGLTREDILVLSDKGQVLPGDFVFDAAEGHHYYDIALDPVQPDLDFHIGVEPVMTDRSQPSLAASVVEPISNSSARIVLQTADLAGLEVVTWALSRDPNTLPPAAAAALPAREVHEFATIAERSTWMLTNTPVYGAEAIVGIAPNRFVALWNGSTWLDAAGGEATVRVRANVAEMNALLPLGVGSIVHIGENSPASDGSGVPESYSWDGTVFYPFAGANVAYESASFVTAPSSSWSAPSSGKRSMVISEAAHKIQSPGMVVVWRDLGGGALELVQVDVTRNALNSIILEIGADVIAPDVKVAVFEVSAAPSGAQGTFNSTTDWTAVGADYELVIPAGVHGIVGVSAVQVWEGTSSRSLVSTDVSVDSSDNVTITVSALPDKRIAGTYTIY